MSLSVKKDAHVIDMETRSKISMRYKRITKAINKAFWNSESETTHSIYVGSYGRGSAINTSDLDVLIELPDCEYKHFSELLGNGPSRLLQAVRKPILDTYPSTDIKADGQVIVIRFSDDMKFEILPAFQQVDYWTQKITYKYPDTNMGGNWLTTDPKAEQEAIVNKNRESNGLLLDTCKHIRYIRDNYYSCYKLSGILIDAFVYSAIGIWQFSNNEPNTGGYLSYEEYLLQKYNEMSLYGCIAPSLYAPGSNLSIDSTKGYEILDKVLNCMV